MEKAKKKKGEIERQKESLAEVKREGGRQEDEALH